MTAGDVPISRSSAVREAQARLRAASKIDRRYSEPPFSVGPATGGIPLMARRSPHVIDGFNFDSESMQIHDTHPGACRDRFF